MSVSWKVPGSSSRSSRSRAVSLPLRCCTSMRSSPPPSLACSFSARSSSNFCFVVFIDYYNSSIKVDNLKTLAWRLVRLSWLVVWRISPLDKLQQHAPRPFGVQEDAAPLRGRSWRLVEHLRPGDAKLRQ